MCLVLLSISSFFCDSPPIFCSPVSCQSISPLRVVDVSFLPLGRVPLPPRRMFLVDVSGFILYVLPDLCFAFLVLCCYLLFWNLNF